MSDSVNDQATSGDNCPETAPAKGTVRWLIDEYRTDRDSPYHSKRWATRQHYDVLCKRIAADFGTLPLADIRARQLKRWHEDIVARGHVAMGHGLVGMIRTLVGFGATILEDKECERLAGMLHLMKFAMAKSRTERLTAEQATLIRREAHDAGRPSIALAQAIQFEGMLRQKDIIGEWVPEGEPGQSEVRAYGMKWLRGIRWEEIDADFVLVHITSKRQKEITIDLKLAPMVVEELHYAMGSDAIGGLQRNKFPATGPVIFSEASEVPWIAGEYRRWWRKLARAGGIPDTVRSMDSRAGAISEATDAGADTLGGIWAKLNKVRCWPVPAEWSKYGNAAGPIRNKKMLGMGPSVVVAFAGGKGTRNMTKQARAAGVEVIEIADKNG